MFMHGLFVAEVADLGQLRMLTHTGWPRSATRGYSGPVLISAPPMIFLGSVVLGQKTEFLRNLLPIFMRYVSEQFETASRDS
jgi:hypothetical protein